jgi:thiamine-monophosphate kinase
VAADTLVAGVHFPEDCPADAVGHRALAVNLSDFAAMGATPAWFTLALTLPRADEAWLAGFSGGLLGLARREGVALIGGDTTAGPLTISVQLLGFVPPGAALRRAGAKPGDLVCVSGTPGDAAAGLASLQNRLEIADAKARAALRERFLHPQPRLALGQELRGVATAAIDISDGLLADLAKLLEASGVGACIELDRLPFSPALRQSCPNEQAREFAMHGGDDYELCFTLPPACAAQLPKWGASAIGVIEEKPGLRGRLGGNPVSLSIGGYDHFRA